MFIGEYAHVIDEKKRVSLPAKFRKEIGKKIILTRGLDNCVFMYSAGKWAEVVEKLDKLSTGWANSRDFNRFMLAGAVETEIDSAGRILVPDFLKEFAGLKAKVIIAGVGNRLEIWDEAAWATYKKRVSRDADKLAEKLGEIGAF